MHDPKCSLIDVHKSSNLAALDSGIILVVEANTIISFKKSSFL